MNNMEDVKCRIGAEIKELRSLKKMSVRKLSEQCGIDFSNISKIEKGKLNPSLETVDAILKPLGATIKIEKL